MIAVMLSMVPIILLLATWPSQYTTAVGGMSVERRTITTGCWHDPESGYYLYKSGDCDGAHRFIMLTKDRRMVAEHGWEVARFGREPQDSGGRTIEERKIDLSALNGIRIGMSRDEVVRKLGPPTRTAVRGQEKQFWCALYKKVQMDNRVTGRVLRNTYIFKHGKLIELGLNLDAIPGCGDDDSSSDEGWPWSKF